MLKKLKGPLLDGIYVAQMWTYLVNAWDCSGVTLWSLLLQLCSEPCGGSRTANVVAFLQINQKEKSDLAWEGNRVKPFWHDFALSHPLLHGETHSMALETRQIGITMTWDGHAKQKCPFSKHFQIKEVLRGPPHTGVVLVLNTTDYWLVWRNGFVFHMAS